MKNVNFLIYWKFPSVPSWSMPFCSSQMRPLSKQWKIIKPVLKINKITAITALSRSCYPHLQLTFSKYLRGGRRWGILVVKGASSPLQWSLCTWKWSWAGTSDQGQSRTGQWGWQHRCHLQKKEILKWGKPPLLCFGRLKHEEKFRGSLVVGFVWVWFFLGCVWFGFL